MSSWTAIKNTARGDVAPHERLYKNAEPRAMANRFFGSAIVLLEAGQLEVVGTGPSIK